MAYRYLLNAKAYEEYIETYEWYELKQTGLGDRFMHSVENRLRQISEHPEYFGKKTRKFQRSKS